MSATIRAVGQADGAPGAGGEVEVVGHQHERRAELAVQLHHEIDDPGAGAGVEIAGGLVGEEHLGPGAEGARERDPLLLAAGELGRIVVAAVAQPDAGQQLGGARRRRPRRGARAGTCTFSRAVSVGMSWKDWKTKPTFSPRSRARASSSSAPSSCAVEVDGAGRGPIESGEQAEQRRLAAAGRPDDGDEAARLHREGDIVQHGELDGRRSDRSW